MTKYILNSGGIRNSSDKGQKFFHEMVSGLGKTPKVLICTFALLREDWEIKFNEDKAAANSIFGTDVQPIFELAFPHTFEKQIAQTNAIYFHGGDDHLVQYWLKQFDVPRIWDGKVIATNSASSHALSESFWTCDWRQCMDGLGILPIKFLAHYRSAYGNDDSRGPIDWNQAYSSLQEYGDQGLPIYALEEGEYKVLERQTNP